MSVRLSPHKVSKILRDYFRGMSQTEIAEKAVVDQSSISLYASRFKKRAAENGIPAAGKEFGVFTEVDALRSLSIELYKAGLTVTEAKQGFNIMKNFLQLSIGPEQHATLIKVCKEVSDPNFVNAAVKLGQIEAQAGLSYHQAISSYENALHQLPVLEGKITEAKAELKSINDLLAQQKQELAKQGKYLEHYKKEVKTKVYQMEQELSAKMRHLALKNEEVEEVAKLKTKLGKQGLDLQTLLKLGKEFSHGNIKG